MEEGTPISLDAYRSLIITETNKKCEVQKQIALKRVQQLLTTLNLTKEQINDLAENILLDENAEIVTMVVKDFSDEAEPLIRTWRKELSDLVRAGKYDADTANSMRAKLIQILETTGFGKKHQCEVAADSFFEMEEIKVNAYICGYKFRQMKAICILFLIAPSTSASSQLTYIDTQIMLEDCAANFTELLNKDPLVKPDIVQKVVGSKDDVKGVIKKFFKKNYMYIRVSIFFWGHGKREGMQFQDEDGVKTVMGPIEFDGHVQKYGSGQYLSAIDVVFTQCYGHIGVPTVDTNSLHTYTVFTSTEKETTTVLYSSVAGKTHNYSVTNYAPSFVKRCTITNELAEASKFYDEKELDNMSSMMKHVTMNDAIQLKTPVQTEEESETRNVRHENGQEAQRSSIGQDYQMRPNLCQPVDDADDSEGASAY